MARIEVVRDDLDGSEPAGLVEFGLDGKTYEIDLSDKNATALRKALDKYIQVGRVVTSGVGRRTRATRNSSYDADKARRARDWAVKKGLEIPAKGRTPASLIAQYEESGGR